MNNPAALSPKNPDAASSLKELAGAAKSTRNRAVDFYRAVAMLAVALGHWAAISVGLDANGELTAGNALEFAPSMSWITWLFQVMPLFFVVGGFSSAMSLDSHFSSKDGSSKDGSSKDGSSKDGSSKDARPQDWIIARLRRMVAPAITLATTWAVLIVAGFATGQGAIIAAAATAAAIPLWFLSNYTIDTALAPFVLPRFRKNPALFAVVGLSIFGGLEALRFTDIAVLHHLAPLAHLNWVLGWLLFQVAGFAWRDGLLPTGGKLAAVAATLWTAAIAAVTVGPWPTAMVHFPGLENSPTHPPSLALLLFGGAYSATALVFAPAISNFLAKNKKAWSAVVGANAIAMSVYLWHMTAAIAACAIMWGFGMLPSADVGTLAWWMQKLPIFALATVILVGIVAKVAKVEQSALLAPRTPWTFGNKGTGSMGALFAAASLLSFALKFWASGNVAVVSACIVILLGLWHLVLKTSVLKTSVLKTSVLKSKSVTA